MLEKYDFTNREADICKTILKMLEDGEGYDANKLAENDFVSICTIKTHINNIYLKTNVHSMPELVYLLAKAESLTHIKSVIKDAMLLKEENRLLKHNTPIQIFEKLQDSIETNKKYKNVIRTLLAKMRLLLNYRTADKIKIGIEKLIKEFKIYEVENEQY